MTRNTTVEFLRAFEVTVTVLLFQSREKCSRFPLPKPGANENRLVPLGGEVPSPANPPSGCRFHTRCPLAAQCGGRCEAEEPELKEVSPGHFAACFLA